MLCLYNINVLALEEVKKSTFGGKTWFSVNENDNIC